MKRLPFSKLYQLAVTDNYPGRFPFTGREIITLRWPRRKAHGLEKLFTTDRRSTYFHAPWTNLVASGINNMTNEIKWRAIFRFKNYQVESLFFDFNSGNILRIFFYADTILIWFFFSFFFWNSRYRRTCKRFLTRDDVYNNYVHRFSSNWNVFVVLFADFCDGNIYRGR